MTRAPRQLRYAAHRTPRRRAVTRLGGAAVLLAALGAGCGAATPSAAPVITVVTGLYPLAQIAAEVGGGHVRVLDIVPEGVDPRTFALGATERAEVRSARVVVDVGGGYQPGLEQAAGAGTRTVSLAPTLGTGGSGPWLDPRLVVRLAGMLAATFSSVNPAAAGAYTNGQRDVVAEMSSVAADFQNSLSDCPRKVILTADATLSSVTRSFGLVDTVVGASVSPGPEEVALASAAVRAARATTVFSEPWVPAGTVTAVARATGVKLRSLDTLIGAPAGGWPAGATYPRLLENDLAALTSALQCAAMGQN